MTNRLTSRAPLSRSSVCVDTRTVVVHSAKQAKYVRDMIRCDTLLTGTREAVETALTGQFVARRS